MLPFFRRPKLSLQSKFFLVILLVMFPILGATFAWVGIRNEQHATAQLVNQARVLARQIILTRQWVSDCEGILVLSNSIGASDTAYFYDDRLETTRGTYQRFTPSMVTKKLSNYSLRENLYSFRLASLNPMNPENEPDEYEKAALYYFLHEARQEVFHFRREKGGVGFQYSVPLLIDSACLECHRQQGFTKGTIGGVLSIAFPQEPLREELRIDHLRLAGAGIALILLASLTLFSLLRGVVIRPLKNLEQAAHDISNGNLRTQVNIESSDEFARLGRAFNTMGDRLARSHEEMEKKVAQATRELSAANIELKKLDRIKTEFFADMSHELRSPITAIQGGVDYLSRTIQDSDSRNYLAIMEKNARRLINLVSDLLDLTRIEAGKVEWCLDETDLAALIQEVLEIMRLQAGEKEIQLLYHGPGSVRVEVDLERMEQVLVNLVDNAIKFSVMQRCVEVELLLSDNGVQVSVFDQGVGIAPQDLEKVFDKFYTLPSRSRNQSTSGTGLGLTICRKIVEAHGGRIWAESRVGAGSVFRFTLPMSTF
jgi:signal transduction histidine kinase